MFLHDDKENFFQFSNSTKYLDQKMKFHDFSMTSAIFHKIHDFSRAEKLIFQFTFHNCVNLGTIPTVIPEVRNDRKANKQLDGTEAHMYPKLYF